MTNLALAYLEESEESLEDYEGNCGELVDGVIQWFGEDKVQIFYIEPEHKLDSIENGIGRWGWSYHMVAVIDGSVHDPWFPTLVLPPDEYLKAAFPGQKLRGEIQ